MKAPFDVDGSEPKGYRLGTHRAVDPEATWARVRPHLPMLGITRIADVTRLDHIGIPVALAIRPNAWSLSVAQGKGSRWEEARVSAAMESIETWHAERIERPSVVASYAELLERGPVLGPTRLSLLPNTTWHHHLPLRWTQGWDLMQREPVWVPWELLDLDCRVTATRPAPCFHVSSNGLASGNTLLEASLHGLLEVVERDSSALWLCRQLLGNAAATKVDPGTIDDPGARQTLERLDAAGFETAIFDETSSLGIPAFGCSIYEREPLSWANPLPSNAGSGCHLDRGVALLRALHEAAQSRLTCIAGSRDDMPWRDYRDVQGPARASDAPLPEVYRLPVARDYRDVPAFASDDLAQDLRTVLAALRTEGIDRVVVVSLERPSVGIAVVRVVVPDLEYLGDGGEARRIGRRARALLGR
ncbi:YcaO-like family protein [Paraliomyxa miuraensis]|uniref:YcaO-like family protein n=1 Tax=Paraliomyxa miuraensis TaxID=376150 RepID=UPI002258FDE2|nr:YcaO-like family protein [Paraliomyxa miuraensis]MCX4241318.1 YcaO-like family protein [Paraliomyxa miuraensis]